MTTLDILTPAQRAVLAGIAMGATTRGIADERGVSHKTIEYHRTKIMQKLNLHDIASLTHWALAAGLVELMFETNVRMVKEITLTPKNAPAPIPVPPAPVKAPRPLLPKVAPDKKFADMKFQHLAKAPKNNDWMITTCDDCGKRHSIGLPC